ncbi:hypothetical protein TH66_14935 [Carbonactinospora thermoautotrophica]|uniref:Excalibur calcium-binding domain-containing protein n=1 Tax=Carbonactinospora thermoautotrophica TaxID=1469144 RepID=A0A132MR12_9ACTN|nr:hypothetical protein [Carbonactinospora thermoautotrophica]KWX00186.1 hypothetical protein TH66_14935 [Carbonactinospora thermoautotrophica]KWX01813.1 hypothetical protein LI90_2845 [Carbonactinospora thermoautotrophica]
MKPTAAPHIQPFAQRLTGQRKHPAPKRTRVSLPPGYDGCDRAYGEPGQCVPWRFPTGVADRCAWLRAHGFDPLPVHGRDRHRLDTNRDGIACGPGDNTAR